MAEIRARTFGVCMSVKQIRTIDAATYKRHMIHGENRAWAETNCYSDVIIEQVHALGFEPNACLPFTLSVDFEGDQWTFFKFPMADMFELYGMDIHELNPWRPLAYHIEEQVSRGRPVFVELDSFFLPDTAGTAYKLAHVKSTISVNKIDIEGKCLGYFHNQGYYELSGQDFDDIFQINGLVHERMLPPYIEYVKLYPVDSSEGAVLKKSLGLLRKHFALVPKENPFVQFKKRFAVDLEWLMKENIEVFHAYSFATLRMYGSCFELVTTYLRWLEGQGQKGLESSIASFDQISQTAKSFQFQLARAMARRKPLQLDALDAMAAHWESGMNVLRPFVARIAT